MHSLRYSRERDHRPISEWIKTQPPHIADQQFLLIHVDEVLRWEVLYAVQRRDARGGRIAKVSNWLVYADGVRDYITAAREHQAAEPARAKRSGQLATAVSLRTISSWPAKTTEPSARRSHG